MQEENKPVWYLAGPMFQYNEDVKALAREYGLRIIDATATADRSNAAEVVPEVTLKTVPEQGAAPGAEFEQIKNDLHDAHSEILRRGAELDSRHEHLEAQAARQREQSESLDAQAADLAAERARLETLAKSLEQSQAKAAEQAKADPASADSTPRGKSKQA